MEENKGRSPEPAGTKQAAPRPDRSTTTAAHRLLMTYFTDSQPRLDAALAASLAEIPDGPAENRGVAFGVRAADRVVALRADDGRDGDLEFTMPVGPGVWRPTGDPPVPFFAPWLSQAEPLVMRAPDQFRPGPPPALTSQQYAREFKEVKTLGSATSKDRTAKQTRTARFFSDTGVGAIQAAVRDLVTRHGMDISESARMLAGVDTSIADSIIASWDAKVHYGYWRPVTAIQLADTDGNPATAPDPTWAPLIVSPPYPDYTSGLNAVVGAATRAALRPRGADQPGRHRRPRVVGSPLQEGRRRRQRPGPTDCDVRDGARLPAHGAMQMTQSHEVLCAGIPDIGC